MKRNTTKGFTLIELLAVIVILAIIALIAVPVILNIIDKANKSSFKDSAYGVLNAAEYYYAASQLDLEGPMETVEMETTDSRLELKGNIPTGKVIITRDGEISLMVKNDRYCITKGFSDQDITITEGPDSCTIPSGDSGSQGTGGNTGGSGSTSNTLATLATTSTEVTSVPSCVTDGSECAVGTAIAIQVNESEVYNFYVLKEENNEVTLIMDRNLGDNVEWINASDYGTENTDGTGCSTTSCNDEGPVTAINALKERTSGWRNISEKTYTVSGLGEDGTRRKYEDIEYTGRARMLTHAEATAVGCTTSSGSCPEWLYKNLYNTGDNSEDSNGNYKYGYWTTTPVAGRPSTAWYVYGNGYVISGVVYSTYYGLRPVITLSKSLISS